MFKKKKSSGPKVSKEETYFNIQVQDKGMLE